MARRFQTRGICKDRVYTIKLAARTIGVSEASLRKWARDGLRLITDKRPYLVRGADLVAFQKKREAACKADMGPGQFYCMTCKAPRDARDGSFSYAAITASTGRLGGVCDACSGNVGRFCSANEAADFTGPAALPHNAGSHA